jgi:Rrf2 family transcriptional regulator, cysteine metabolism repressor
MKFSTRTRYGLKAVFILASRFGQGSMPVSAIAKKERLSPPYLEQILHSLKKKGLVKSVRGPQGGYVLTKKPADITLKSLFYALEAPPAADPKDGSADPDESAIANALFWNRFRRSLDDGLGDGTLKDLLDEARRLRKAKPHSSTYTFHI